MRRSVAAAVACLACGCGLPIAPAQATLVTIAPGTELLTLGATETFAAFAARADGSGGTVGANWATSSPSTVAISQQGQVTAVGAGVAIITATFENLSGSRTLRVVPSFSGSWSGRFLTTACSGTSCGGSHAVGGTGVLGVFLTQVKDQVSGLVFIDTDNVPVAGTITTAGALSLTGDLTSEGASPGPYVSIRLDSWTSTLSSTTRAMTGRFTHLYADRTRPFPYPLSNRVDSELVNVIPTGPP